MDDIGIDRITRPPARHKGWRITLTVLVFLATYGFGSLLIFGLLSQTALPEGAFQVIGLAASLIAAGGASFLFWRGTRSRTPFPAAVRRGGPDLSTSSHLAGRIGITAFVFLATFVVVPFVSFSLALFAIEPNRFVMWGVSLACATAASVAWWRWSRGHTGRSEGPGPLARIVSGGAAVGAVGFLLGFVGPMIFSPESNQGPLLGIFFTGPLGFFLGAIGGYVYWLVTRNRAASLSA